MDVLKPRNKMNFEKKIILLWLAKDLQFFQIFRDRNEECQSVNGNHGSMALKITHRIFFVVINQRKKILDMTMSG